MNIAYVIFPFIENYIANKEVRKKRDKYSDRLNKINNSDSITIEVLKQKYGDSLFVKDKLEDKAKSNVVAITISITLILGASSLLNSVYSKFSFACMRWIVFAIFITALVYIIIAGILSIRVIINENMISTVMLNKHALDEKHLRQEYDKCTESNEYQNIIRNNGVYSSYGCMRNALVCLFIIAVLAVIPYATKQNAQSLSVNTNSGYNIVFSSDAVNHILQYKDQAIIEAIVIDAVNKGTLNSKPAGILNDTQKLFIKASMINKTVTILIVEIYK